MTRDADAIPDAIDAAQRATVEGLFAAVRRGSDGVEPMMRLFRDDAVVTEGATGDLRRHVGAPKIRALVAYALRDLPPGLRLKVERIEREPDGTLRADWSAKALVIPLPWRGSDYVQLDADARVARLDIVFDGQERPTD
ncbi:MAG: hypothetical protein JNM94_04850 [Phycisphaerae bacterium]|nr:hypothetical protein [Phycisphaerae bacterium]